MKKFVEDQRVPGYDSGLRGNLGASDGLYVVICGGLRQHIWYLLPVTFRVINTSIRCLPCIAHTCTCFSTCHRALSFQITQKQVSYSEVSLRISSHASFIRPVDVILRAIGEVGLVSAPVEPQRSMRLSSYQTSKVTKTTQRSTDRRPSYRPLATRFLYKLSYLAASGSVRLVSEHTIRLRLDG